MRIWPCQVEQLKSERKQTLEYEMEKIEERAAWQKFLGPDLVSLSLIKIQAAGSSIFSVDF